MTTLSSARDAFLLRVRPRLASAVRTTGTWALDQLGGMLQRLETLPGFGKVGDQTSPPSLELVDRVLERYVEANPNDSYARTAAKIDRFRYAASLDWLRGVVRPGDRVLELGGRGPFSDVFQAAFPQARIEHSLLDLREPIPFPEHAFDVVLCMEVIEHVCDVQYAHATTLSGVKQCLAEIYRVLKPGGSMLLTTPNAAGATVMHRLLRHEPPWNWEYHFREFTIFEIQSLVKDAGFAIERVDTVQVWSSFGTSPQLLSFLWLSGASVHARGDNTFLLARRGAT